MSGDSGASASSVAVDPREPASTCAALAAALDAAGLAMLDDHALVEHVAAAERLVAWATSVQLAALAEFARRPSRVERVDDELAAVSADVAEPGQWVREFADAEIAARLRISRLAASTRIRLGCALARLPATRAALRDGRIDVGRARVVADEVADLDLATAREVEASVIDSAERLPAARLRAKVRRAVIAADPVAASERGERARGERRVWITPAPYGMADLYAHLPAADAVTVKSAVVAAARAMRAARASDDRRTMDQLMADAFVAPFAQALATGVLDGATPTTLGGSGSGSGSGARRGRVELHVTVAASTLLGHDDAPAQLRGYGPITADVARELAPDARWRRILTDPRSGAVLDVGRTTYRPPADLRRHVELRDQLCSAPGCGWPAEACDLDHTVPFPEGSTSAANLAPRCRRHHRLKQAPGTRVERDPDGGETWTMPTGHRYRIDPPVVGPVQFDSTGADDRHGLDSAGLAAWEGVDEWNASPDDDVGQRGPPQ